MSNYPSAKDIIRKLKLRPVEDIAAAKYGYHQIFADIMMARGKDPAKKYIPNNVRIVSNKRKSRKVCEKELSDTWLCLQQAAKSADGDVRGGNPANAVEEDAEAIDGNDLDQGQPHPRVECPAHPNRNCMCMSSRMDVDGGVLDNGGGSDNGEGLDDGVHAGSHYGDSENGASDDEESGNKDQQQQPKVYRRKNAADLLNNILKEYDSEEDDDFVVGAANADDDVLNEGLIYEEVEGGNAGPAQAAENLPKINFVIEIINDTYAQEVMRRKYEEGGGLGAFVNMAFAQWCKVNDHELGIVEPRFCSHPREVVLSHSLFVYFA